MSTLEQILERGRKEGREEGLEKGLYKTRIFNLLKTAIRFPGLSTEDLSDFTELELGTVSTFLKIRSQGDEIALQKYVREDLLADIPMSPEEEEKLAQLIEQLTGE